jgi:hypothetical protein
MNARPFVLAFTLTSCAHLQPAEIAYQSLHVIDTLQTIQIARSTCYWENAPGTQQLIGKHPGTAGAIAWGIATALSHYGITRWMEASDAPGWAKVLWQAVTIGRTSYYVKNNYEQGIGLTGSGC